MTSETKTPEKNDSATDKLLESRTLIISQEVDSKLANKIMVQLVLLEKSAPGKGITVFINSPGGEVFSGFAIYDMLQFIECPITTVVSGFAASMGSILSLAATPGRRFAFPHAKIMIHQPLLTGYQGRATDCEIQARELLKTRDLIIELYCQHTNRSYEEIKKAIDRDNWFSAEDARDYGLLDRIITSKRDLE